jgi:hypothetical protein
MSYVPEKDFKGVPVDALVKGIRDAGLTKVVVIGTGDHNELWVASTEKAQDAINLLSNGYTFITGKVIYEHEDEDEATPQAVNDGAG